LDNLTAKCDAALYTSRAQVFWEKALARVTSFSGCFSKQVIEMICKREKSGFWSGIIGGYHHQDARSGRMLLFEKSSRKFGARLAGKSQCIRDNISRAILKVLHGRHKQRFQF